MEERNKCSEEKCQETLLEDMAPDDLNEWLSIYVAETRKLKELYPPTTIHQLLAGIQYHMRAIDQENAPNIFAKNDPAFLIIHVASDNGLCL